MRDRRFQGRRRGGRYRSESGSHSPSVSPEAERGAHEARTAAETGAFESVFQTEHQDEIEEAEARAAAALESNSVGPEAAAPSRNKAPDPAAAAARPPAPAPGGPEPAKSEPAEGEPAPAPGPQNLVDSLRDAARRVVARVTRVAVMHEGRLDEFTIERTNEERLVGSIFKGRVRNLEDGLKAAFVDIGFERNAFLHYWDIVPSQFDSNVEVVERNGRKRDRPKITQKDVPRLYPAGSEIIVQVTKGPIGTKGPRITTNISLPGRYLVLLPNSDQSGISRKIRS